MKEYLIIIFSKPFLILFMGNSQDKKTKQENEEPIESIEPIEPVKGFEPISGFSNNIGSMGNNFSSGVDTAGTSQCVLKLLYDEPEDQNKKTVAVVVTINHNMSFDKLFTSVKQKAADGTKVEVYSCNSFYLDSLIQAFDGQPQDDVAKRLMKSIGEVDPDCVVFNWECCQAYVKSTFPEGGNEVFCLLKKVINKGHMCMFSDFSLKALIADWDEKYELGPNPFKQIGQWSGNFVLRFSQDQLKECPSAQLRIVGQIAETGMCNVNADVCTIVYSVDKNKLHHNNYKLQVLTVVPTIKAQSDKLTCKSGQFQGNAGHVLLTYPSGGKILTSMGHWMDLMKIQASPDKIFQKAEDLYSSAKAAEMKEKYSKMNEFQQKEFIEFNAKQFIQNQAPCDNMVQKQKFKLKKK